MHTSSPLSKITLRDARILSGYTPNVAAKEAKVSVESLRRYEQNPGKTPIHIAVRLSNLYNISIDRLSFKK
ncbi:helix-turn-helix domain-containing protein [Brevibacillus borstelensis]|nr:hypothetical protein BBO01nite_27590 [Brevibacillus borstelensis]